MMTETKTARSAEALKSRNLMQRELLMKCIAEGLFTETDLESIKRISKLVSDIIDNPQEEHQAIRDAYESGDYDFASRMLLDLIKAENILE
ncbi:MAG: hypothetical protein WC517_00815 [Patescibacteria group bacterium]